MAQKDASNPGPHGREPGGGTGARVLGAGESSSEVTRASARVRRGSARPKGLFLVARLLVTLVAVAVICTDESDAVLVEMDGLDRDDGVCLIASFKQPAVLEPALVRPGGLDRKATIDPPVVAGRPRIVEVHGRTARLRDPIAVELAAPATSGLSGEERRITARHEPGHRVVAAVLPDLEPILEVAIFPPGTKTGVTLQALETDGFPVVVKPLRSNRMLLRVACIAGRTSWCDLPAEARNDVRRTTDLSRRMVCDRGMSDTIGPVGDFDTGDGPFPVRESSHTWNHGESIVQKIDEQVRRVVHGCYVSHGTLLRGNKESVYLAAGATPWKGASGGTGAAELIEEGVRR